MGFRFTAVIGAFVIGYSSLIFQLYRLQIGYGEYYQAKAASQYEATAFLEAKRGTIYFTEKNGNKLATGINKDFPVVFAVPKDIADAREAANTVAQILGEPVPELLEKLSKEDGEYKLLKRKVDPDVARKIDALKMKGIYTSTESLRFYPLGGAAAHLLGFVGPDEEGNGKSGHYGIEKFYEERLAGTAGELKSTKLVPPEAGEDLALTIDPTIQIETERILDDLIGKYNAKGGGAIVMDPKTGAILAITGKPDFDPNDYGKYPLKNFLNPMVQEIYEPGSVFKVLTMAAGIDSGKITPETTYVDTGSLVINGRRIQNYDLKEKGPYGRISMTKVIERSVNTGAVFAEREMGRTIFTKYMEKFGLGEKTKIDLPGELPGDIRNLNSKARDIAFATASYGQGVAVTPVGMISAIAAIANDGELVRPYVNAELTPQTVRRVLRKATADKVTGMMISAVDKAEVAKINGYSIAGKTGTAFIPDFEKGGYTERVINTYVGFGPASNPRFIVLVKLNEPEGNPVAGLTVVPAFRDLAQFILNYYNVPPDRIGDGT